MVVAIANGIARDGSSWGPRVFWAGMLMLWLPAALRILNRATGRPERVALLLLLAVALYVVKVLYSPRYFVGYDELLHVQTADSILRTGKILSQNPVLPVSPLYPGLELVTNAVSTLTGLSTFVAGTIVVGVARIVTVLGLYLLYDRIGRSSWIAGLGALVYMTNPHFTFNGAYAYESLALALAVLTLYGVARVRTGEWPLRVATPMVLLPLVATAETHHVTSFLLVAALVALAVASHFFPPSLLRLWHWAIALAGAAFVAAWLGAIASTTFDYLSPPVQAGIRQVVNLIRGDRVSRGLFQSYGGQTTAPFDRATAFAFAAITVAGLAYGLLRARRARIMGVFGVVFVACSLLYPLSNLFRFTTDGAELADRIATFVFVPVAFFVALSVAAVSERLAGRRWAPAALAAVSALLLYGGISIGSPAWQRLPGPYLVSADSRSIEPEGISAAVWTREFLGPGNRIGADRIGRVLMMTYGRQRPVTSLADHVELARLFFTLRFDAFDRWLLGAGRVRYMVIDDRITRSLPQVGDYVDPSEPGAFRHRKPVPRAALAKFDNRAASRVFDSGHITVYDVRRIRP